MSDPTVVALRRRTRRVVDARRARSSRTAIDAARADARRGARRAVGRLDVAHVYELLERAGARLVATCTSGTATSAACPLDDQESNHRLATRAPRRARARRWHPLRRRPRPARAPRRPTPRELGDTVLDVALQRDGPRRPHRLAVPRPPAARRGEGVCARGPRLAQAAARAHHADAGQAQRGRTGSCCWSPAPSKAPMLARVLAGPEPDVPASLLDRGTAGDRRRRRRALMADERLAHPPRRDRVVEERPAHRAHRHPADRRRAARRARALAERLAGQTFALVLRQPAAPRARDRRARRPDGPGRAARRPHGVGLRRLRGPARRRRSARSRPDWYLWRDGVPGGETADEVGARASTASSPRSRAVEGDVALVAHGHVLRVLAARWLEAPAAFGAPPAPRHGRDLRARLRARRPRHRPLEPDLIQV